MEPILLVPIVAATAVAAAHWAMWRSKQIDEADYYGKRFTSAAKQFLSDETVPEEAKALVRFIAPHIDNETIAKMLGKKLIRAGADSSESAGEEDEDLDRAFELLGRRSDELLHIYLLYFFALSYQDPRNGWHLRRKFTTDRQRALSFYGRSVDRIIHGCYVPDGLAA